jgi:hypothetical protein
MEHVEENRRRKSTPLLHRPIHPNIRTALSLGEGLQAMVLAVSEQAGIIRAVVGIFFSGIVAGCSCADDPTPVEPQNEYCELRFEIARATGEATVSQIRD